MPRVVDTDAVRPQDRFDFWVEAILRACFPLTLRRRDGGREPFRASVHQYFLGPVAVSRIRAPATALTRTSGEVRAHDPDTMQIALGVAGCTRYVQGEHRTTLGPGGMVVYDTARPFRLESDAPTEVIVVETSKAMLGSSLDWARSHCAEPLRGPIVDGVVAPFLRNLADALDAGDATEHEGLLGESTLSLLRAVCGAPEPVEPPRHGPSAVRARVKVYIDDHLDDPSLDLVTIAAAHYVSPRYLQKLFKAEGLTVSGWIRDRRLAGARRDLADPARAEESITSIAARWGLSSSAHLSRAFRVAYGCTPSDVRAEALERARSHHPAGGIHVQGRLVRPVHA